jgi:ATP-dependent helicase Lhr and Lhr-like helicase
MQLTVPSVPEITDPPASLPEAFLRWFAAKGWQPRPHQIELLARVEAGRSALLIAPTGAGKTLAGFLPSLVDCVTRPRETGLHTLYLSPLKALAVDIERNLAGPVSEMGLPITIETRTGDTPAAKRRRQRTHPPDILLTTPEQLALLISDQQAKRLFATLRYVVVDELHALATNKRGHLMALGLARLRAIQPQLRMIGLSATVADPEGLCRFLVPQSAEAPAQADLIVVKGGALPDISILQTTDRMPWQGHTARFAVPDIYEAVKRARTALIFVNTRFQAELMFQELWRINEDNLPIALHHGSLDATQRRKVERAMAANELRAVVATSTLELGIDWGDVDLVLHIGGPKGASRLAQRIGRANHRMDEPSRALLVPTNRFEVLECQIAIEANYVGGQDTDPVGQGNFDVLAQHVWGVACAGPFAEAALYQEVISASPYAAVTPEEFARVIAFVATGGYALKVYERYARIVEFQPGWWRLRHPRLVENYRLNIGTIVESPSLLIRLVKQKPKAFVRGGLVLGKVEEAFLESLVQGDTFVFSGRVVCFEGIRENECIVTDATKRDPMIPSYAGGKFPMSTYLAAGVRALLANPERWQKLPDEVAEWLQLQTLKSVLPRQDEMLAETFPRNNRHYLVIYPFEGRIAHQTLGMLLTRRLERAGAKPMGFVANDYALAIWGLEDMGRMIAERHLGLAGLFDPDMLGDDLEAWLDESYMLKRTFRYCAVIAGLIERRHPGREKTGRQVTVSTDLIYDVLRRHEPDHLLLQATRRDAERGLLDIRRVNDMLNRISGRIVHKRLDRISPLAVPVMLEIGKEPVMGNANDALLQEAAESDAAEAIVRDALS